MKKAHRPENPKEDFTFEHYREILKALKTNHRVISFKDAKSLGKDILNIDKFVILRHDVEFSVTNALKLAIEDNNAGLNATFFFLLSGDYNIFEHESANMIRQIIDLGHDIGLHYDAALFEDLKLEPIDVAAKQISLIETYWNTKVYAMSSHLPLRSGKTFNVPNVIDVYESLYINDIKYISDSTQVWREDVVSKLLDKYPKIHLL
ncbi:hypothetical protein MCHI_001721, partial [Candidatus Magnetoovum chiemensis]